MSQTGVAGGSVIEDWCVIGGQVGIGDNVRIKSGAILGSKSGVLPGKILHGDGQVYWGVPARPLKDYLETLALQGRLREMKTAIDSLLKLVPRGEKPLGRRSIMAKNGKKGPREGTFLAFFEYLNASMAGAIAPALDGLPW